MFRPVRFEYQKILHALFNQTIHYAIPIEYNVNGFWKSNPKLNRSFSHIDSIQNKNGERKALARKDSDKFDDSDLDGDGNTPTPTSTSNLFYSRYHTDFVEIEKLGSGGFGSVYKVKNLNFKNILYLSF